MEKKNEEKIGMRSFGSSIMGMCESRRPTSSRMLINLVRLKLRIY